MSQAGIINVSGQTGIVDSVTGSGNVTASPTTGNVIIGLTGITQYDVLVGGATNTITNVSPSTAGFVLTSNGVSANPTFQASSGGSGITTINGDSGSVTGSTVSFYANTGGANAGASVQFNAASATQMDLNLSTGTNTFLGYTAGNVSVSGSNNTSLGTGSLSSIGSGSYNVAVGAYAMPSLSSGSDNIAIGYRSNNSIGSQSDNIGIGNGAYYGSSGSSNIAIGTSALQNTSGNFNTCMGFSAMLGSSGASASNSAIGHSSLAAISSGSSNSCLGDSTGTSLNSGSYNVLIGQSAGSGYTTGSESSNILLSASGTASESNVMRLGTAGSGNGQVSTCYIAGITGVTVTGTAVLCSATGQLGTIASSERYKENIEDINENVSIMNLRPVEFNYKQDKDKNKVYGLIAEEIHKDFPYLCFYKDDVPESVKYHELPILLLKEIQKLNKRIEDLESSQAKKKK